MRSRFARLHPTSSIPHERMHDMKRSFVAAAVLAALLPATAALAQTPAKAKDAPAKAATSDKVLYSQAQFDLLLKERVSQNAPDTPELRNAVKEELNTRELLAREARK